MNFSFVSIRSKKVFDYRKSEKIKWIYTHDHTRLKDFTDSKLNWTYARTCGKWPVLKNFFVFFFFEYYRMHEKAFSQYYFAYEAWRTNGVGMIFNNNTSTKCRCKQQACMCRILQFWGIFFTLRVNLTESIDIYALKKCYELW